jgi:outer membrane protein OmpA-like peptidoglycan-associated protein/chitodextrinase
MLKGIIFYIAILISATNLLAQDIREISKDSADFKMDLLTFCEPQVNYFFARPLGKHIIFCSNLNRNWGVINYNKNDDSNFSDIYSITHQINGEWEKPKPFSNNINTILNEGAFCFNDSFNIIYYTTNTPVGQRLPKDAKNNHTLKIYKAEKIQDKWGEVEPLIFNSEKYNIAHPSLSSDMKKLYFSSDMPGGYGGADIYVSYWQMGQWSKPINLGKNINTKGNETFPFIASDGKLYFSSDGKKGHGMMDIYSSDFINSEWKNVRNIGKPINSAYDDFGFYIDIQKNNGYFSSNRNNKINDQVYKFQWFRTECPKTQPIENCFTFFEKSTISNTKLPLVYEWDFGDGNKQRGTEVGHCYAYSGNYQVQLNIVDTSSNQLYFTEATYDISVAAVTKPYIEFSGTPKPGQVLEFNGNRSRLPKAKITDMVWDFGDGSKTMGQKAKHVFQNSGKYKVTLYVHAKDSSTNKEIDACVIKNVYINPNGVLMDDNTVDSLQFNQLAETIFYVDKNESPTYKVQLQLSETPIETKSENFKGIENVQQYQKDGYYGYTVGESTELENLYPLFNEIKIKGFNEAQIVAFDKSDKMIGKPNVTKISPPEGKAQTHISGRVITRYGDVLPSKIVIENLTNNEIVKKIDTDPEQGTFSFVIPNNALYGYFAERDSFYSVSNNIDLRLEKRNLEIKKNIEMIPIGELNEDNIALRINNLFFGIKEYNIDKSSYPELKRLVKIIKSLPHSLVEIGGHTDNSGDELYNQELSLKRAASVKEYLVSNGCRPTQIEIKGYGSLKPIVSNATEKGRYLNRRVEIKFSHH